MTPTPARFRPGSPSWGPGRSRVRPVSTAFAGKRYPFGPRIDPPNESGTESEDGQRPAARRRTGNPLAGVHVTPYHPRVCHGSIRPPEPRRLSRPFPTPAAGPFGAVRGSQPRQGAAWGEPDIPARTRRSRHSGQTGAGPAIGTRAGRALREKFRSKKVRGIFDFSSATRCHAARGDGGGIVGVAEASLARTPDRSHHRRSTRSARSVIH